MNLTKHLNICIFDVYIQQGQWQVHSVLWTALYEHAYTQPNIPEEGLHRLHAHEQLPAIW